MPEQESLFESEPDWQNEWVEMPEYNNLNLQPFRTLIVHFESEKDCVDFEKTIGQRLTSETKSIWFPELTIEKYMDKRYSQNKNKGRSDAD